MQRSIVLIKVPVCCRATYDIAVLQYEATEAINAVFTASTMPAKLFRVQVL